MTLLDYAQLEKAQQIKRFWNGVLIGQRFEGQSLVECRQIDSFYVEYKMLEKHPQNLRYFEDPDLLHPYLATMDIEALLA